MALLSNKFSHDHVLYSHIGTIVEIQAVASWPPSGGIDPIAYSRKEAVQIQTIGNWFRLG